MNARATRDVVMLMLAATVCAVVVLTGFSLLIVHLLSPSTDIATALSTYTHVVALVIGVVLGYVSRGRTDTQRDT